jgi:hypothetical protein
MADTTTNRVTRKMVNDALRARGRDESLYSGDGYFFFGGGDAVHWLSSSVTVKKLSDLTLAEWLAKFDELLARENNLREQMSSVGATKTKEKRPSTPSRAKPQRKTR